METLENGFMEVQDVLYTPESVMTAATRWLNGLKDTRQIVKVRGVLASPSQPGAVAFAQLTGENPNISIRLYFSEREGNMSLFKLLQEGVEYIFTGIVSFYMNKDTVYLQITPVDVMDSRLNTSLREGMNSLTIEEMTEFLRGRRLNHSHDVKKLVKDILQRKRHVQITLVRPLSDTAEEDILGVMDKARNAFHIIPAECDFRKPGEVAAKLKAADSSNCDIIVFARGGGEYLKKVDDKEVLKALANLKKPLITGLGHHNNHLLAELFADKICSVPAMVGIYFRDMYREICDEKDSLPVNRQPVQVPRSTIRFSKTEPGKYFEEIRTFYGIRWTDKEPVKWFIYILCLIGLIQVISFFV